MGVRDPHQPDKLDQPRHLGYVTLNLGDQLGLVFGSDPVTADGDVDDVAERAQILACAINPVVGGQFISQGSVRTLSGSNGSCVFM
jgi:hypothetical protein